MSYINNSFYKPGCWNVICDVCGFQFKSDAVRFRWDGLIVCKEDWEPDHPQKYIRVRSDPKPVPFVRYEGDSTYVSTPPATCNVLTQQGRADIGIADCARADVNNFLG